MSYGWKIKSTRSSSCCRRSCTVCLKPIRLSVLGNGYVGAGCCGGLAASGHEVVGVGTAANKVAMSGRGKSSIVEDDIDQLITAGSRAGDCVPRRASRMQSPAPKASFISVGIPSRSDGSISLRAVDEVVAAIGRETRGKPGPHTFAMHSTVPLGAAEDRAILILERARGQRHGDGDFYAPSYILNRPRDPSSSAVARG